MLGGLPTNRTVNGFAVSRADPAVMYVAMRDGLFKSVNAGETWKPMGKRLGELAAVAVNPRKPDEVYVSTTDGVIFRSPDGGSAWERRQ